MIARSPNPTKLHIYPLYQSRYGDGFPKDVKIGVDKNRKAQNALQIKKQGGIGRLRPKHPPYTPGQRLVVFSFPQLLPPHPAFCLRFSNPPQRLGRQPLARTGVRRPHTESWTTRPFYTIIPPLRKKIISFLAAHVNPGLKHMAMRYGLPGRVSSE